MKVFMIAAVTADGFIDKEGETGAKWTSKSDKTFFRERTKSAGIIVMGSRTYESIGKPLPGRRNIVLSRAKTYEGVEIWNQSPRELIDKLRADGVKEVAICGGSKVYTSFMKDGLIDSIYLTVEPVLFGRGVHLFSEKLDLQTLEMVETRSLGDGAVLLEYSINNRER